MFNPFLCQKLPRLWPAGSGDLSILPHAATEAEPRGGHFVACWSHRNHGTACAAALTQPPGHGRFMASCCDLCLWLKVELPKQGPTQLLQPCVVHRPRVSTMSPACAPCTHPSCFCPAQRPQRRPPLVAFNVLVETEDQCLISHRPTSTVKTERFPEIRVVFYTAALKKCWATSPCSLSLKGGTHISAASNVEPAGGLCWEYWENNSASTSETFMKTIWGAKSFRLKTTGGQMMAMEHRWPGLRWRKTMQRAGDLPQHGQGGKRWETPPTPSLGLEILCCFHVPSKGIGTCPHWAYSRAR